MYVHKTRAHPAYILFTNPSIYHDAREQNALCALPFQMERDSFFHGRTVEPRSQYFIPETIRVRIQVKREYATFFSRMRENINGIFELSSFRLPKIIPESTRKDKSLLFSFFSIYVVLKSFIIAESIFLESILFPVYQKLVQLWK